MQLHYVVICHQELVFADINVSQGSVATYARCGGNFNIHLTTNLLRNLPVIFLKSVKIWQNYGHDSVAPLFGPPCNGYERLTCHTETERSRFDHRPFRFQVTTLGKLFAHMCLCNQAFGTGQGPVMPCGCEVWRRRANASDFVVYYGLTA